MTSTSDMAGDRTVLPPPDPSFRGRSRWPSEDSEADFPEPLAPPRGAPNVLLVMGDDIGYGHMSAFGGPANTPMFDRLAAQGLSFTNFHTTAVCAASRAALLTGRNAHTVAMGAIPEVSIGFPGYNAIIPRSAATVLEILHQNGYGTAWSASTHLTPIHEITVAGPFDRWPGGMGTEYFYGFFGPGVSQWYPPLWENTTPLQAPGRRRRATTWRPTWPTRRSPGFSGRSRSIPTSRGSSTTPRARTSRRSGCRSECIEQVPRPVRRRLRPAPRPDPGPAEGAGDRPGRHQARPTAGGAAGVGRAHRHRQEGRCPLDGGLLRRGRVHRPSGRPHRRGDRGDRRARQHADHLHRRRQRPHPRGRPARHHEQAELLERRPRVARRPGGPDRRLRSSRGRTAAIPPPGPTPRPRRSPTARTVTSGGGCTTCRGGLLAGADHRPGRPPLAVPPSHRHGPDHPGERRGAGADSGSTASTRSRWTA